MRERIHKPKQAKKTVTRGKVTYVEERLERGTAIGYVERLVQHKLKVGRRLLDVTRILVRKIRTQSKIRIPYRAFHYGKAFQRLKLIRGTKIAFEATVYKLTRVGQAPHDSGKRTLYEIRNPRNIRIVCSTRKRRRNDHNEHMRHRSSKAERQREREELLQKLIESQRQDALRDGMWLDEQRRRAKLPGDDV